MLGETATWWTSPSASLRFTMDGPQAEQRQPCGMLRGKRCELCGASSTRLLLSFFHYVDTAPTFRQKGGCFCVHTLCKKVGETGKVSVFGLELSREAYRKGKGLNTKKTWALTVVPSVLFWRCPERGIPFLPLPFCNINATPTFFKKEEGGGRKILAKRRKIAYGTKETGGHQR